MHFSSVTMFMPSKTCGEGNIESLASPQNARTHLGVLSPSDLPDDLVVVLQSPLDLEVV